MKKNSWSILCGVFIGTPILGLALLGTQRIQAAGVTAGASPTPQTFTRKVYTASLSPLNGSSVTGNVQLVQDGDHLGVDIEAFGLDPTIPHPQFIRSGTECPTAADDQNGDGFVDAVEAVRSSGPPVLPLTLSGQPLQVSEAGASPTASPSSSSSPSASPTSSASPISSATPSASPSATGIPTSILTEDFPLPSSSGHLVYIQSFPGNTVEAAFPPLPQSSPSASATPSSSPSSGASPSASPSASTSPSASPSTAATALANVDLTQRVVTIHGFAPGTFLQLPMTLGTILGLPSEASLPVACGVVMEQPQ